MIKKENRPKVKLMGKNGNIFNLLAISSQALRKAGYKEEAKEMRDKVTNCSSYMEALNIIYLYVEEEE